MATRIDKLQTVGKYLIKQIIAATATAVVFRAENPDLEKHVAVKVFRPEYTLNELYRSEFLKEAKLLAKLDHPAILDIYDAHREHDLLYLVMPLMAGTLSERINAAKTISPARIISLMLPICEALDYANSTHRIVHRDIKPANLLFNNHNHLYLADFGIAVTSDMTHVLPALTPAYASPEQLRGERQLTVQSDLYSLGMVIYEALVGQRPYELGPNKELWASQVEETAFIKPTSINVKLDTRWDEVLERALGVNREERFATAAEFAEALSMLRSKKQMRVPVSTPHTITHLPTPPPISPTIPDNDASITLPDLDRQKTAPLVGPEVSSEKPSSCLVLDGREDHVIFASHNPDLQRILGSRVLDSISKLIFMANRKRILICITHSSVSYDGFKHYLDDYHQFPTEEYDVIIESSRRKKLGSLRSRIEQLPFEYHCGETSLFIPEDSEQEVVSTKLLDDNDVEKFTIIRVLDLT